MREGETKAGGPGFLCLKDTGRFGQMALKDAKTKPHLRKQMGFWNLILTMTYSHMGKPHTTIGDASFHY
jgi:hypothetical protein